MSGSDWEMEKGNSPCVERISCVREMGLSVWREGDGGARCVDRGLELGAWSFFARCVDRSLESSVCVECVWESRMENVWSENEDWNDFPPQKPYFTVKLKIFLVWPNLPDLPNILFSGKGFLNSIWSQNKWTLSPYPITSHVNIISIYKKCL